MYTYNCYRDNRSGQPSPNLVRKYRYFLFFFYGNDLYQIISRVWNLTNQFIGIGRIIVEMGLSTRPTSAKSVPAEILFASKWVKTWIHW